MLYNTDVPFTETRKSFVVPPNVTYVGILKFTFEFNYISPKILSKQQ